MKQFFLLIHFLVLTLGFVAYPQFSHAQTIVENIKKPMPEFEQMPLEKFTRSSQLYDEMPFDDEFLSYKVRIPNGWAKGENKEFNQADLNKKVMGEIDRYFAPTRLGERSYFSIQAEQLAYRLTAEQWVVQFVLENGYNLEGMRVVNDNEVEMIYVLIEKGNTYIVSAKAILSGPRIIFIQYVSPTEVWQDEQASASRIIESFELQNYDDSEVEALKLYEFLDIAKMEYPSSWRLVTKPLKSAERMSLELWNVANAQIFNQGHVLKGKMEIHLITDYVFDDDGIEQGIAEFKENVVIERLTIKDEVEQIDDFVVDEAMELVEVKVYEAVNPAGRILDYEFWLAVMKEDEYYYFLTLLTPSRDSDYLNWARNTQTLRVVAESIGPLY